MLFLIQSSKESLNQLNPEVDHVKLKLKIDHVEPKLKIDHVKLEMKIECAPFIRLSHICEILLACPAIDKERIIEARGGVDQVCPRGTVH